MKHEIGSKAVLNFPAHPMRGQTFEVASRNSRHKFDTSVRATAVEWL